MSLPLPTFFIPFVLLLSILGSFLLFFLSAILFFLWGSGKGMVSGWLCALTHWVTKELERELHSGTVKMGGVKGKAGLKPQEGDEG